MAEAKKFIMPEFSQPFKVKNKLFDTDCLDKNIMNIKYIDEQDYVAFVY